MLLQGSEFDPEMIPLLKLEVLFPEHLVTSTSTPSRKRMPVIGDEPVFSTDTFMRAPLPVPVSTVYCVRRRFPACACMRLTRISGPSSSALAGLTTAYALPA